jgi:uncharacterized membrane protein YbhN (UPF0104 family)
VSTAHARRVTRRHLAGAAGAIISLVFIAAIVWWASRQEAPELPSGGKELGALALAVVLYFVSCAVRGERWQVLLEENGAQPHRADTYGLIAVGYLGNNVLPARAGDALRVVLLTPRAKTDARTVIGTLVAERLCDVLVLGVLFVVLAYALVSGAGLDAFGDRLDTAAIIFGAVLLVCVVVGVVLHTRGHLSRALDFVRPMVAATRNLRGRHGAEILVLTVVVWALEGAVWYFTSVAAGMGIDLLEAYYVLALASMLVLVPAGPGYAGTMDAAVLVGAKALDASSSAALSYLILLRFVLMVPIGIAGLVIGATRYGGISRVLRSAR